MQSFSEKRMKVCATRGAIYFVTSRSRTDLCLGFLVLGGLLLQLFLDQLHLITEGSRVLCAHLSGLV